MSPQVYTHSQSPHKSTHIVSHTDTETSLALEPSSQSPRKSTHRQALLLSHLHKVPASLHTFTMSPQVYTHSQSPHKSTHIHNVPTSLHTLCHTQRETSLALEPSSQSPHKSTHIHNVPTSLHTLCHTQRDKPCS